MSRFLALGLTALTLLSIERASADPMTAIVPHRAVYDMALADTANGSNLTTLAGRLVYDLQGTPCEGFTVNFRLVTQFADSEGERTTTDLRSSTFEEALDIAGGTGRFRFLTRNFVNQVASDETDGEASRQATGIAIDLRKPEEADIAVASDVMFPTEHLGHLLEAAKAGERVFQAAIYDGSEDGVTVNDTTAIIGEPSQRPSPAFDILDGTRYWPITLSYYDEGASGDQVPNYEISFDLFENGISDALTLDYGAFSVSGELASLDIPEDASDARAACASAD